MATTSPQPRFSLPSFSLPSPPLPPSQTGFSVEFQRTLRIPDIEGDTTEYPLPPSLGSFPLERVQDHKGGLPGVHARRGGVMMPMYQKV